MHEEKAFVARSLEIVCGRGGVHECTYAGGKTRQNRHQTLPERLPRSRIHPLSGALSEP